MWDNAVEETIFDTANRRIRQHLKYTTMSKGFYNVPVAINERVRHYAPGTHERETLKEEINKLRSQVMDIPMLIGGKEVRTDNRVPIHPPHDRKHLLGH